MVRASIGAYTSVQDIDGLVGALREISTRPDHYSRWHRASSTEAGGRPDRHRTVRQLEAICRGVLHFGRC